jgi:hypothetical protein
MTKTMKKTFLFAAMAATLLVSCNNEKETIIQDDLSKLRIQVSAAQTRAMLEGTELPDASKIGTALVEDGENTYDDLPYMNVAFTATGEGAEQEWNPARTVYLSSTTGILYSYYPYSESVTDIASVPVQATTAVQTDYMYGTAVSSLNNRNTTASITMNHALAAINIAVKKGTYTGTCVVTKVGVKGAALATSATLNAKTGVLTGFGGTDTELAPAFAQYTMTATPTDNKIIVIPTGESKTIGVSVTVDGVELVAETPAVDLAEGTLTKYTITVNSESLEITKVAVTPWNDDDQGDLDAEVKKN